MVYNCGRRLPEKQVSMIICTLVGTHIYGVSSVLLRANELPWLHGRISVATEECSVQYL